MSDSIGDRFKAYEAATDYVLPPRMPMVIRVDGRGFHGLKLRKPFDRQFIDVMVIVARALCEEIQGAVLAYSQSDEISIIARDDMRHESQPWFGKRLSKVVSVAAGVATARFNELFWGPGRHFDARAFTVPDQSEATNYLIWRQQDALRNSVQMCARAKFSHKQCHQKNTLDLKAMLADAGAPWEDLPTSLQRGAVTLPTTVERKVPETGQACNRRTWMTDYAPPLFTENREYIAKLWEKSK